MIQALAAKWLANADLTAQFSGRIWQSTRDTSTTANPASGTHFPYAIIPVGGEWVSVRIRTTCAADHWEHQVAFRLYHNSFAECAALAPYVLAVFSSQSLSLTLDAGGLIRAKEQRVRYAEETEGVHYCEIPYEFETSFPLRS